MLITSGATLHTGKENAIRHLVEWRVILREDRMQEPRVEINNAIWNRDNGLRITLVTGHGGGHPMFSVKDARLIARLFNDACDEIEQEQTMVETAYKKLGKLLGI